MIGSIPQRRLRDALKIRGVQAEANRIARKSACCHPFRSRKERPARPRVTVRLRHSLRARPTPDSGERSGTRLSRLRQRLQAASPDPPPRRRARGPASRAPALRGRRGSAARGRFARASPRRAAASARPSPGAPCGSPWLRRAGASRLAIVPSGEAGRGPRRGGRPRRTGTIRRQHFTIDRRLLRPSVTRRRGSPRGSPVRSRRPWRRRRGASRWPCRPAGRCDGPASRGASPPRRSRRGRRRG